MIEKELAGPLGVVVKASTLRDYGVDNFFFLENKNTDTNQRNVVFIARGESARNAHAIAGEPNAFLIISVHRMLHIGTRGERALGSSPGRRITELTGRVVDVRDPLTTL